MRDFVSVPSAFPSPCVSICSPAGTRGFSGWGEALGNSKATHLLPSRAKVQGGGEREGISRPQEPLLSSEQYQLLSLASGWN